MDLSVLAGISPARNSNHNGRVAENNDAAGGVDLQQTRHMQIEEYPPYEENGRWYHGFRRGMYMYPCDDAEQERLDIFHKLFSVARFDTLTSAPLNLPPGPGERGPRILDLGCGTGIWAIEMARRYKDAYVLGIDLAPIQPPNPPYNCEFQVPRDFEGLWTLGENSWDLIHLQMGCGSVSSWPNLYKKVFRHLRPGGYFEQVEINFEPHSDHYVPTEEPLYQWYYQLKAATSYAGKPIAFNRNTPRMLEEAGFEDVKPQLIELPLNSWRDDPHEKEVGKWYNLAFSESATTLLQGPLTRVCNWPLSQIQQLADAAVSQAYNKNVHVWHHMHIFTARKPG
ncbi:hypothetical protein VTO42DRAFT_2987 [Malbranchea cinnamomea]